MKSLINSKALPVGLALFSMFFGAGNVIFPLAVGQYAGDKNFFAVLGLILTAALMPIIGVIAMILFDGNYRQFFGRLGRIPGFLLACTIISLLGPLGSTPRCIALSYTTFKNTVADIPLTLFSALSCAVIFLCTVKKNYILKLLGWILTPLLLISLITIILIGIFTTPDTPTVDLTKWHLFFHGLKEGYNTMDLLAAFFFSSTILTILRAQASNARDYIGIALKASGIAAVLLAAIYVGFSYLASFHGVNLILNSKDEILAALVMKIAGSGAGLLVCITIILACITTEIALISAFADFFQKEVFKGKVSYEKILLGALGITFGVATLEFTTISAFLGPILEVCYPGLIVLTLLNMAYQWKNFKPIKGPVFLAFALSAYLFLVGI